MELVEGKNSMGTDEQDSMLTGLEGQHERWFSHPMHGSDAGTIYASSSHGLATGLADAPESATEGVVQTNEEREEAGYDIIEATQNHDSNLSGTSASPPLCPTPSHAENCHCPACDHGSMPLLSLHLQDEEDKSQALYEQLRASLTTPQPFSSSSSSSSSYLDSNASTPRASYARTPTSTAATTPYSPSSASSTSSASSSDSPSGYTSPRSRLPKRKQSSSSSSPIPSSCALASSNESGSHTSSFSSSSSLVTIHQAISVSLYVLVTFIASITLLSILLAGYGLTLADDLKDKIGIIGRKAEERRKRITMDLERWLSLAMERIKMHRVALEQGSQYPSSSPSAYRRKRRASFPQTSHSSSRRTSNGPKDMIDCPKTAADSLKSSIAELANNIAYLKLPLPTSLRSSFSYTSITSNSSTTPRRRNKSRSQPSSRPRSRCSSPRRNSFPSSTPQSASSSTSSNSSSSSWSNLPPRPPLSVLIPGMMLALALALVAFFRNGKQEQNKKKKENYKEDSSYVYSAKSWFSSPSNSTC